MHTKIQVCKERFLCSVTALKCYTCLDGIDGTNCMTDYKSSKFVRECDKIKLHRSAKLNNSGYQQWFAFILLYDSLLLILLLLFFFQVHWIFAERFSKTLHRLSLHIESLVPFSASATLWVSLLYKHFIIMKQTHIWFLKNIL